MLIRAGFLGVAVAIAAASPAQACRMMQSPFEHLVDEMAQGMVASMPEAEKPDTRH